MAGAIILERGAEPFPLAEKCVIGRKHSNDIVLDDQRVSREHAMIMWEKKGDSYMLFDLDSANGTLLNSVPVSRPTRLKDGDRIQIGDNLLTFQSEQTPVAPETTFSDATIIGFQEHPMLFLVADVKGYTQLAGKLTDGELTELMRQWYASCEKVIKAGGAIIDKFIGDCVFAYWMSTTSEKRAAAVASAHHLLDETAKLSARNKDLLEPHGLQLECGIGLHCGLASLGAMVRGQKTALGDAVNLAFRVESLTRHLETNLLLSNDFTSGWDAAAELCESCGHHSLKGIDEPVEVFRLKESAPQTNPA